MATSKAWALQVLQEIDALESLAAEHELAGLTNSRYYDVLSRIEGMKRALEIAKKYGEL